MILLDGVFSVCSDVELFFVFFVTVVVSYWANSCSGFLLLCYCCPPGQVE